MLNRSPLEKMLWEAGLTFGAVCREARTLDLPISPSELSRVNTGARPLNERYANAISKVLKAHGVVITPAALMEKMEAYVREISSAVIQEVA